jgi:hypothetical protein
MFRVNNPFEGWQPPTTQELTQIAREESEAVLAELADEARQAAHGAWERYANKLGVFADQGETYMGLPPGDEDEEAAFDTEYGTDRRPPAPLLRTVLNSHQRRLEGDLSHRLVDRVVQG